MLVFKEILKSKYELNPGLKQVLLVTHPKTLIEFVRSAKRMEEKEGRVERWGGLVENGRLYGENWMGNLHTELRDELLLAMPKPQISNQEVE